MRDDLDVLLTSTSEELTGTHDPELERWLLHLRSWYGWSVWPRPVLPKRRREVV